jgi:hypothetical protein
MNNILLIIILLFVCVINSQAQQQNNFESVGITFPPVIDVVPGKILVPDDSSKFVVRTVNILNRGGGELNIKSVNASCACSNATILSNNIYFLSVGEMRLEINKDGLTDGNDSVVFSIVSNAKNSPYYLTVTITKPDKDNSDKADENKNNK